MGLRCRSVCSARAALLAKSGESLCSVAVSLCFLVDLTYF
jgi:hypothetical protein